MHCAANDCVYLYLNLRSSPADQQSCFTVTTSSGHVHFKALRSQSFCAFADGGVDSGKCVFTPDGVIREDEVQVNGQPGHVPHEEVDRGTALECQPIVYKNERSYLGQ